MAEHERMFYTNEMIKTWLVKNDKSTRKRNDRNSSPSLFPLPPKQEPDTINFQGLRWHFIQQRPDADNKQ
jgi:hypothetical protein